MGTMLSKRFLRILIVADLLLVILGTVVAFATESSLPEPLRAYEEARSEADITAEEWVLLCVGIPLIIAVLVATIGLLVFWRPARPLYLGTIMVTLALTPFAGPYVASGWSQAIEDASLIIAGVILALIYWSPLKDFYERPKIS